MKEVGFCCSIRPSFIFCVVLRIRVSNVDSATVDMVAGARVGLGVVSGTGGSLQFNEVAWDSKDFYREH